MAMSMKKKAIEKKAIKKKLMEKVAVEKMEVDSSDEETGRVGKTRLVAEGPVIPKDGICEGQPIPPLYTCVQVLTVKAEYADNQIDIPTVDVESIPDLPNYPRKYEPSKQFLPYWALHKTVRKLSGGQSAVTLTDFFVLVFAL
ncbi:hypothetical protein BAE44_0014325 [Dichanthelium oligosanthes]|uniref:Uncharacterized protein n=1 Tax=Dichanthelium oligosanthes TaxID=888268 RepID=A0A1E5VHX6_9POAL|nr:hypothetical protein BAE44_0014325 [Dichanthelium oligosanthes]